MSSNFEKKNFFFSDTNSFNVIFLDSFYIHCSFFRYHQYILFSRSWSFICVALIKTFLATLNSSLTPFQLLHPSALTTLKSGLLPKTSLFYSLSTSRHILALSLIKYRSLAIAVLMTIPTSNKS